MDVTKFIGLKVEAVVGPGSESTTADFTIVDVVHDGDTKEPGGLFLLRHDHHDGSKVYCLAESSLEEGNVEGSGVFRSSIGIWKTNSDTTAAQVVAQLRSLADAFERHAHTTES